MKPLYRSLCGLICGLLLAVGTTVGAYQYDELAVYGEKDVSGAVRYGYLRSRDGAWVIPPQFEGAQLFQPNGLAVVQLHGKQALLQLDGQLLTGALYDQITIINDSLIRVRDKEASGFINAKGEWLLELRTDINPWAEPLEGLVPFTRGGKTGFLDLQGKEVIAPLFSGVQPFQKERALINKDKKSGFINRSGQVVIEPQWDAARSFSQGLAAVKKDGKWGFINEQGETVIEPAYDDVERFTAGGIAAVKTKQQWGLIDRSGKVVAEPQYSQTVTFRNDVIVVKKSGKSGAYNSAGQLIVPLNFEAVQVYRWQEPYLLVRQGDQWGVMDMQGRWLVQPQFAAPPDYSGYWLRNGIYPAAGQYYDLQGKRLPHFAGAMNEGYRLAPAADKQAAQAAFGAALQINPQDKAAAAWQQALRLQTEQARQYPAKQAVIPAPAKTIGQPLAVPVDGQVRMGFIDMTNGHWLIAPQLEAAAAFNEAGLALARQNGKFGYLNPQGQWAVTPQFSEASTTFSEGLAAVRQNGRVGFIDAKGVVVIKPQFADAFSFHEGMAAIVEDRKFGYIDKQGKIVVPLQYDLALPFHDGLANVSTEEKAGFIDKQGQLMIQPDKGLLFSGFNSGLAPVVKDKKFGYINQDGDTVIACQYEAAGYFENGLARVRLHGKFGVINTDGQLVVPAIYDAISEFRHGIAAVRKDKRYGCIDATGKMVLPLRYKQLRLHEREALVEVMSDKQWGVMNAKGEWTIALRDVKAPVQAYWPEQNIVMHEGYLYDLDGKPLNHYINHLREGYYYLQHNGYTLARQRFEAALAINPGDQAALWGLTQVRLRETR